MQFNPEFMCHCFNTNPTPYNLRRGSRLLIPPAKSVNFGTNSVTFKGNLLWNNLPLRIKISQIIDDFKSELKNLGKSTAIALCVASDRLFLHFYSLWVFRWVFWFSFLTYSNIYLYFAHQGTPSSYKKRS